MKRRVTASALKIREFPFGVDTGKRLIRDQVVTAWGSSWDDDWLYVSGPEGSGWASANFLAEVPESAPVSTSWPRVPHGLVQIRETFGEPGNPSCSAGMVTIPDHLRATLAKPTSWDPGSRVTRFACHILLVDVFTSVFTEIYRRGYWGLIEDFGGCYQVRAARGLQKASTHSWGIACDLNVASNPLGATPKMPLELVAIFRDHGFLWGGLWSRPDGMHFQYATGY